MKRTCSKCLLPVDYLNIELDKDGVCQHCRNYQITDYLGSDKLKDAIKEPLDRKSVV